MSVERALSCWTSSKSAVSERNWVGSVGLSGSWFSSWEMSSFKKVSELTPFNVAVLAVTAAGDRGVARRQLSPLAARDVLSGG